MVDHLYTHPFEIQYVHHTDESGTSKYKVIPGLFRVTLADRVLLTPHKQEFHEADYMFRPERILECARCVAIGIEKSLRFNPESRKFCLHFTPVELDKVKITEDTSPDLSVTIPRLGVAKKLSDCYKDVCTNNNYEIDQEGIDEYSL